MKDFSKHKLKLTHFNSTLPFLITMFWPVSEMILLKWAAKWSSPCDTPFYSYAHSTPLIVCRSTLETFDCNMSSGNHSKVPMAKDNQSCTMSWYMLIGVNNKCAEHLQQSLPMLFYTSQFIAHQELKGGSPWNDKLGSTLRILSDSVRKTSVAFLSQQTLLLILVLPWNIRHIHKFIKQKNDSKL